VLLLSLTGEGNKTGVRSSVDGGESGLLGSSRGELGTMGLEKEDGYMGGAAEGTDFASLRGACPWVEV